MELEQRIDAIKSQSVGPQLAGDHQARSELHELQTAVPAVKKKLAPLYGDYKDAEQKLAELLRVETPDADPGGER